MGRTLPQVYREKSKALKENYDSARTGMKKKKSIKIIGEAKGKPRAGMQRHDATERTNRRSRKLHTSDPT